MTRKLIVLALLCVLTLSVFVACGDKTQGSTPGNIPSENTEPQEPTIPIPTEGSKTLLIYMCGSNLETKQGLAGKNIDELLSAEIGENVNIVIQTGGAKTWRKHGVSADRSQRYIVKNGKLELLSSAESQNMGEAKTLTDFLQWGQQNYYAESNFLILWDHGGGAAKGVCFDENYSFDALTLRELDDAFRAANLKKKFDVIGFDACLMASIEVAAVANKYADYMIASEEIVPGGGLDYKTVAEALSDKSDTVEIGKEICDSFMEKCASSDKMMFSTLSLLDLSEVEPIIGKLDEFGEYLEDVVSNQNVFANVLTSARMCEKFGYDNLFEKSANLVDFYNFAKLVIIEELFAIEEVQNLVVYSVNGGSRNNAGVSFYYPLNWDEWEIRDYIGLGVSAKYNHFLATYYLNAPKTPIKFADSGSIDEDGAFAITLSDDSRKYMAYLSYLLIEEDENGQQRILFSDADIAGDWDKMTFKSNFKGIRRLFEGHLMCSGLLNDRDKFLDYSAPAIVNGKHTFLRYYFDEKSETMRYFIPGTCAEVDENGLPITKFVVLDAGDRVQLADYLVIRNGNNEPHYGEEFEITEYWGGKITEVPLDGKTYQYVFIVTDIFGNNYYSDMATFEMAYTYESLLENPLPEGTYAADVTKIEPYNK